MRSHPWLLAILNWLWKPAHPSEVELIAYGRELGRQEVATPQVLHLPTGQWRAQYFAEHPHLRKPPVRSLWRVELLPDDSWLNSGPPVRDTEPTETMPAVKMQALHPRRG